MSIQLALCGAIAIVAAAIADPLVEFASNAGWFGRGSFTDHSNLDVVPALFAGVALMVLYLARRARAVLAGHAFPHGVASALPTIFAFQILALYVIETAEQVITSGHVLGPVIWLGGPLPVSFAVHAAICVSVTFWVARSVRSLAATTLKVIQLIRAIAMFAAGASEAIIERLSGVLCFKDLSPLLCQIGERAPPTAPASV